MVREETNPEYDESAYCHQRYGRVDETDHSGLENLCMRGKEWRRGYERQEGNREDTLKESFHTYTHIKHNGMPHLPRH